MADRRLDPSSSSNLNEVEVAKWHWKAVPDFTKKTLRCNILLEVRILSQGAQTLVRRLGDLLVQCASVQCCNSSLNIAP